MPANDPFQQDRQKEFQARITALLLGEYNGSVAAELCEAIDALPNAAQVSAQAAAAERDAPLRMWVSDALPSSKGVTVSGKVRRFLCRVPARRAVSPASAPAPLRS